MKFDLAYQYMLKGERIKRPSFKGYWFIDGVSGKLTIHLANGTEINEGDLGLTVLNTLADDWMIYRKEFSNGPHQVFVDNYGKVINSTGEDKNIKKEG